MVMVENRPLKSSLRCAAGQNFVIILLKKIAIFCLRAFFERH